jgi:N-acetylglucosaminyldiphosphoundecaprenol N-acetyl-beta-D-mannosaminyltransferase
MTYPVKKVLGISVAAVDMGGAMKVVDHAIQARTPLQIGVVNAAKVVNMQRDPELQKAVLGSDIIFADGMSIVWASRILGHSLPTRVTGIDLMFEMLALANKNRYRVYLLGARQSIIETVAQKIEADYPDAIIAGFRNGYFDTDEEQSIADHIRRSRADMLFVAITSPKKEKFLARWEEDMRVPVSHGVGGSFDVYAGLVRRAPALWQKLGLEWLYRTAQEPARLWKRYLYTNLAFTWMIIKSLAARSDGPENKTDR